MEDQNTKPAGQATHGPRAGGRGMPGRSNDDQRRRGGRGGGGMRRRSTREEEEFEQAMIELSRVTRVMAGGKRMRFRACVVIGDRAGRVGWGVAKGADVAMAMQKANAQAKKNVITVPLVDGTIPHEVHVKFKAAKLMLKPAKKGRGIIAGGVVRTVLSYAGVKDIVSKTLGSNNKINNVAATFEALTSLRRVDQPKPVVAEADAPRAESETKK